MPLLFATVRFLLGTSDPSISAHLHRILLIPLDSSQLVELAGAVSSSNQAGCRASSGQDLP
jgi:hypothetical protein